jgi:predicted DNA-binding antitoxin AbrB/MazE fold protein
MEQVITATFEDGAFKPDSPVVLTQGTRVRLVVAPLAYSPSSAAEALEDLEAACHQSPVHAGGILTRDQLHERR